MKKFLVSVLAIAGLVACNNEQTIVQQGPAPMEFAGAFVENATRANDPSITTASLNAFDVWAYVEEKAGTVLDQERVTRVDDTKWTYSNKQYWTPNHDYYFTAIAPVDTDSFTNNWAYTQAADKIDFTNVNGTEDLLYAYEKVTTPATINQDMSAVALQFEHLLSKVNFKFKNGFATSNVSIVVKDVQMTAPKAGTYHIAGAGESDTTTGEWILGEGSVDLVFGDVEQLSNGASASAANELLTIPASAQQSYTVSFTVELYNGTVKVQSFDKVSTITGVELEKGNAYNFVAEITPENLDLTSIEFTVDKVAGWDESQANSLEASLRLAAELGGKVTLTDDVVLDQPLVVSGANTRASHAAVNLEIDLNGKSISYTSDVAAHSAMITVESGNTLVIKDTVGGGKISYNYTGAGDSTFHWGTYTIANYGGTLVIENGTVEMLSNIEFANHMLCAVYQYSGSTTINGGKISTPCYRSARLWKGDMTINGGEFEGQLWVQAADNSAKLTINGGSFAPSDGDSSSVFVTNSTYTVDLDVTGGTFATKLGCSDYAKDGVRGSVTGGVFGEINSNLVADGYNTLNADERYYVLTDVIADAANAANVKSITESTSDFVNAIETDNGEGAMFFWNDVAYIATQNTGSVVMMPASTEGVETVQYILSNEYKVQNWPLTSVVVAEGIEVVGNRTFKACYNLQSVALPSTITEIGPGVFQSCSSLTSIDIPAGVTVIGEGAFSGCRSLETINIPAGVTRIEKDALRETGLKTVEFHEGITYFGTYAFRDCEDLKEIIINAPSFQVESNTFLNAAAPYATFTIYVANAEMKAYLESKLSNHEKQYITVVAPNVVSNSDELKEAVANKAKAINISGEIDLANVILSGYNGTIVGVNDAVLNTRNFVPSADEAYQLRSQNLTIKNCTIKVPTEDGDFLQTGFVGTGVIVFENCKFEGQVTLNGSANWTFNDCEFASIENGAYASFVYGATKATFNNCSFRGVDRAAKIYGTGGTLNVEYNNCTYTSATLNKAGVEIDATYAETTVVLKGCSQTAMKDLYALKGAKGTVTVL